MEANPISEPPKNADISRSVQKDTKEQYLTSHDTPPEDSNKYFNPLAIVNNEDNSSKIRQTTEALKEFEIGQQDSEDKAAPSSSELATPEETERAKKGVQELMESPR